MDDPTVAVWSLSISWCQSHIGQLVQLVQLLDLFGFAKLAFGGIGTLETARTASVHSLPAPRRRGSTNPRAHGCFPSWNMKLSAGARTVDREYIFDNVESIIPKAK